MSILRMAGVVLIFLVFRGCSANTLNNRPPISNLNPPKAETIKQDNHREIDSIKNTKGLITLSDKYGKKDFVRIYNEDGSLWYEFTFYYDDSDGKFDYENENFAPFSFHQDYFVLALKCVGEDDKRYEVIVDEDSGLTKFVPKNDPNLKLETWQNHILKRFAVDFNKEQNPLRKTPEGDVLNVNLSKEATFHPVEIKADWLKVSWDKEGKSKENSGWIRWKENERLLIELFYMA